MASPCLAVPGVKNTFLHFEGVHAGAEEDVQPALRKCVTGPPCTGGDIGETSDDVADASHAAAVGEKCDGCDVPSVTDGDEIGTAWLTCIADTLLHDAVTAVKNTFLHFEGAWTPTPTLGRCFTAPPGFAKDDGENTDGRDKQLGDDGADAGDDIGDDVAERGGGVGTCSSVGLASGSISDVSETSSVPVRITTVACAAANLVATTSFVAGEVAEHAESDGESGLRWPSTPQVDVSTYPLPSVGSQSHGVGTCRPCAHSWRPGGCSKGRDCTFCHLCTETEFWEFRQRKKTPMPKHRLHVATSSAPAYSLGFTGSSTMQPIATTRR